MSVKNLVIVESPAKGKTIEKFLGKDFTVKASFGHIRDLEKKDLGIDIENGFKPRPIKLKLKIKLIRFPFKWQQCFHIVILIN